MVPVAHIITGLYYYYYYLVVSDRVLVLRQLHPIPDCGWINVHQWWHYNNQRLSDVIRPNSVPVSLLSATNEQLVVETRFYVYQVVRLNYTTLTDVAAQSKAWCLANHLLGLQVRIRQGAYECYVLSSRGLCAGLITRPEESYRVWCVWVWSWSLHNEGALAHCGLLRHREEKKR